MTALRTAVGIAGILLVLAALLDAFETIVLPRRVSRRWRITVVLYRTSWPLFRALAARRDPGRREAWLSYYGPASLLFTIASWVSAEILGYSAALWGLGGELDSHAVSFGTAMYVTASTYFTIGFGDVVAHHPSGRALVVAAGGTGFASLALLVSYLPTLYQAFSRREVYISQLDGRAGSPPTAGELLIRLGDDNRDEDLRRFLLAWEGWSADLLESLLSFPALGYYRSHHDNQSWVAALTAVLDTSSLVLVSGRRHTARNAKLTYAMCRHAAVDLARVLHAAPAWDVERLDPAQFERLRAQLARAAWELPDAAAGMLSKLRAGYEPFLLGLAEQLLMPLPGWTADGDALDSWRLTEIAERTGPGERSPGVAELRD